MNMEVLLNILTPNVLFCWTIVVYLNQNMSLLGQTVSQLTLAIMTHTHTRTHTFTCVIVKAGCVEFAHVELQADDGEHEDGKEKKQANLQQRNHGLHDGFEHHL